MLPEIHASYSEKIYELLAAKGYMSYDFFLPGLIIYATEHKNGDVLVRWAEELVSKKIRTVNMLGCHDGIPLLDLKGFLPDEEIDENALKELEEMEQNDIEDLAGEQQQRTKPS